MTPATALTAMTPTVEPDGPGIGQAGSRRAPLPMTGGPLLLGAAGIGAGAGRGVRYAQ